MSMELIEVTSSTAVSEVPVVGGAVWLSIALLAAGYARTRNRSPWAWFFSTALFGPFALFLLVVWPAVEPTDAMVPGPASGGRP